MRALLIVGFLAACGSGGSSGSCHATDYPCGPYGFAEGATIADLTVTGQRDANGSGSAVDDPVAPIHLHDYSHDSTLTALVIIIGAVDCVPCQNEQPDLVATYHKHQPQAAFLEAIVQGAGGAPADQSVIDGWASNYALPFDLTADPTSALAPYYPANTFPSAMAIRTSDMSIVYQVTGPADGLDAALSNL